MNEMAGVVIPTIRNLRKHEELMLDRNVDFPVGTDKEIM